MNLNDILNDFIKSTDNDKPIEMGEAISGVTPEQKDMLIKNLIKENGFNKVLIIVVTAMFVILFLVGIFFALYYRDQPSTMGVIFGGTFLTLLGVIKSLQNLWVKKSKMDMLLTIIPGVSPEQTLVVIETLLHGKPAVEKVSGT